MSNPDHIELQRARHGRVYLAGPMTGYAEWNFPAFNAAAARLRSEGFAVVNPADHGIVEGAEWGDYLRFDIAKLAGCESIAVLPEWSKSKGATLEVHIATTLGMSMLYLDGAEREAAAMAATVPDDGPADGNKESLTSIVYALARLATWHPTEPILHQINRLADYYADDKISAQFRLLARSATPHSHPPLTPRRQRLVFSGETGPEVSAQAPVAGQPAEPSPASRISVDREVLTDLIAEHLRDTYHCTRVWGAWGCGTMGEGDFEPVDESDTPAELADAIIAKFASQAPTAPEGFEPYYIKGLDPMFDALNRAVEKGYMPDAIYEAWVGFDYRLAAPKGDSNG